MIITKWDQILTVLKAKKKSLYDFDSIAYPGPNGPEPPPFDMMKRMTRDAVRLNMNVQLTQGEEDELVNKMWTRDLSKFVQRNAKDPERLLGAYQSYYSLIQQDEYLFVKYFQNSKHIPQIYGSCGHFYAMEYLPPGKLLSPKIVKDKEFFSFWKDRAEIALSLLDLVESFQSDFHHELHICDVKGENFGQGEDGLVKLIDTDAAFFEPKLKELLENEVCDSHSDCDFFDCKGYCDPKRQMCLNLRINSNLQVHVVVTVFL